jgi:hypothetical protein
VTEGNGKKRKPKPQSVVEQDLMRNAQALLQRSGVSLAGKRRVLTYLGMAIDADLEAEMLRPMAPAPVDPPNQLKVPGTTDEELPFE